MRTDVSRNFWEMLLMTIIFQRLIIGATTIETGKTGPPNFFFWGGGNNNNNNM